MSAAMTDTVSDVNRLRAEVRDLADALSAEQRKTAAVQHRLDVFLGAVRAAERGGATVMRLSEVWSRLAASARAS